MFCFILMSFPWSYCFRQISFPVARERHINKISCPPGPFIASPRFTPGRFRALPAPGAGSGGGFTSSFEGVFRKIRSSQTTGDEPLQAGNSCFHLMFCSRLHVSGRLRAMVVVPSPFGPLHAGQLAAMAPDDPPPIAIESARQNPWRRPTMEAGAAE